MAVKTMFSRLLLYLMISHMLLAPLLAVRTTKGS